MKNLPSNLGYIQRLKVHIPFSTILNEYIEKKFESIRSDLGIDILFVGEDPYFTSPCMDQKLAFQAMKTDVLDRQRLEVWTGASEVTIFGEPSINWKFRAIHDILHVFNDLDFSASSELQVNYIQQAIFSFDGLPDFERQLLNIETAGQVVYFEKFGKFPEDQRKFTVGELYKFYNMQATTRDTQFFNESKIAWNL